MADKAPVFDKILADYLMEVDSLEDKGHRGRILGFSAEDNHLSVPFFLRRFIVRSKEIMADEGEPPSHASSVLVMKYILLCPEHPDEDKTLVTYKDFKDASPYVEGFRNTAERPIARHFEGRLEDLRQACLALGGTPFQTDVSCDLAFRFQALPKVPVFLLFNDADEDFGGQCILLFQKNAASFLDMECIAIVGGTLAFQLQQG
jgi:hypothetical protein